MAHVIKDIYETSDEVIELNAILNEQISSGSVLLKACLLV